MMLLVSQWLQRMILIPDEVIEEHNLKLEPEMFLRNEKGKEWPVKIGTRDNGQKCMGKGLYAFLVDNNVGRKESCKFTIGSGRTMKVQIIR